MAHEDRDWTDTVLRGMSEVDAGFDEGPYKVTARVSRLALHIARHQAEVFGRFGLNRGDAGVLSALRISGPPNRLSPTQLFKGLMLSSAGITSRIDRLEKSGLVRRLRDPKDRRGVLVELTDAGRKTLDEAVRLNTLEERTLVATLTPLEMDTMAGLLKKMLAELE